LDRATRAQRLCHGTGLEGHRLGRWPAEFRPDLVVCARNDLSKPHNLDDHLLEGGEVEKWN
jgi:hypothetical protein